MSKINELSNLVTLYFDSQSVIHLCKNPVYLERTKHIDVKLHFIRDIVSKDILLLEKIATQFNPADMDTKVLPLTKFKACLQMLKIDTE